jgi:hypothetical protein
MVAFMFTVVRKVVRIEFACRKDVAAGFKLNDEFISLIA